MSHLFAVTKVVSWIGETGAAIILILLGALAVRWLLVHIVSTFMQRAVHFEQSFMVDLDRQKRVETFTTLINAVLSVAVWIIAGILVLQQLGVQTGPLLTGAGVLGIGLAFGTQSLVKDFISGLFIVMENQYRVGDEVELDNTKGRVEHVGIRTTVLRDEDGSIHFVPNGIIQRTTNRSMGHTPLTIAVTIEAKGVNHEIEEWINRLGQKMASEKKWQPHFLAPMHYTQMGEEKEKTHTLLVSGRVKNAYRLDIFTEFKTRLQEKLERKEVKVTSIQEVVAPAEPKEKAKK